MIANARNEARINELEILLEQETRKIQDVKNELLKDLEAEKARREYSEENLMLLKEGSLAREMEDERTIQELESKLGRLSNERNTLLMEYKNIQEQYDNLHLNSQEKIRSLEDKLNQQERQYRQLEESSRLSLERNKKESEQNLYDISRDYQNKLEIFEENLRNQKNTKENLENEVKLLKNQISQIKNQAQVALNELEYKIKEEENNKYNSAVKNFEGRIKTLEESRENLNKRLQELQKEYNQNERKSSDCINALEITVNQYREEKADLTGKLQKVSAIKDNFSNELYVIKSALERANNENDELNKAIKERKEAHLIQLENMCQDHAEEKKSLEGTCDMLTDQINLVEQELNKSRRERDRIIKEHEYLAENLKQRASSLIQDIVLGHMEKLEGE